MLNIAIIERNGLLGEAVVAISKEIVENKKTLPMAIAIALSHSKYDPFTGADLVKAVSFLIPELNSRAKVKTAIGNYIYSNVWYGERSLRKIMELK